MKLDSLNITPKCPLNSLHYWLWISLLVLGLFSLMACESSPATPSPEPSPPQTNGCEGPFTIDDEDTQGDIAKVKACTHIEVDLTIRGTSLSNLDDFSNLGSVGRNMAILNNPQLANLSGLSQLSSIGRELAIAENDNLGNLSGLPKLDSIKESLNISRNENLLNLGGLDSLSTIEGEIRIDFNPSLASLEGLQSLRSARSLFLIRNL